MAGDTAVARAVAFAATVAFGVGALFGARFGRGGERAPAPTERAEKTREAAAGATATATPSDDASSARPSPPATRRPNPAPRQRSETVAAPIGVVHSCFSRRNGTPRQGGDLVPSARCVFFLDGGLPRDLLSGLDRYSHCWVLYEFHANTNRRDTETETETENISNTTRNGGAVKGKARVPRLDGAPVGALATRTPHRPTPIGLSLGSIVRVDADTGAIVLGGCDLVDGTPVLDIKPYVPFCDAVRDAVAPAWVRRGGARPDDDDDAKGRGERDEKHDDAKTNERRVAPTLTDEPLEIAAVRFDASAETAVAAAYLRSVKARRARRLAGLTAAELARLGKRTSKPNANRIRTNDDAAGPAPANGGASVKTSMKTQSMKTRSGVVITAEETKRVKREAKARRPAGVAFPDALYDSGESFVSFVKEVLSLDVRAARERVGVKKKFETYRVVLCDVEVEYAVLEEPGVGRVVVVRGGTETAPLAKPGVTADRRPEKKQTRYE